MYVTNPKEIEAHMMPHIDTLHRIDRLAYEMGCVRAKISNFQQQWERLTAQAEADIVVVVNEGGGVSGGSAEMLMRKSFEDSMCRAREEWNALTDAVNEAEGKINDT